MNRAIIFCGSPDITFTEHDSIGMDLIHELREKKVTVFIHGSQKGSDRCGARIAADMGLEVVPIPADWRRHGDIAVSMRNRKMLRYMKATGAVGTIAGPGGGTSPMTRLTQDAGHPVFRVGGPRPTTRR